MTLTQMLILIGLGLFVLLLILFPEFRKKLKVLTGGFLNIWVEDKAKTPEGAKALYSQAIEEAQGRYNAANDTYQRLYGKLETLKKRKTEKESAVKQVERSCEELVKANKMQDAAILAEQREDLVRQLTIIDRTITELEPRVKDAQDINTECQRRLKTLKSKSKEVVESLEMNRQLKDIYDDMDELKKTTTTSKLLESIDDEVESTTAQVAGARAIHENKASTKIQKANAAASQVHTSDYLDSLKKKYNK